MASMQLAVFVVAIASCFPQTADISESELGKELKETIQKFHESEKFTGTVLAELNGTVIAKTSAGTLDDSSGNELNSDTLYELGSVTKPFTALALLILERKGKLSLDDSISDHLPDVPKNCKEITLRHLLLHTSGIPGTNYGPHTNDVSQAVKAYLRGGPKSKPGTRYEYWNQGYALLAAVIAEASGNSYTDTVRKLIFEPVRMARSCFTGADPVDWPNVAIGTSTFGKARSALEHPYGNFYGLQYQGMGGLVSNVDDLYKFVKGLRKSPGNVKKILEVAPNSNYGLGWRVEKLNDSQTRVSHGGSVRGFLASISWYPEHECCLIVLANSDDKKPFFVTEAACRKLLEGAFIKLPKNEQFNQRLAKSLIGKYRLQSRTVTISKNGKGLEMVIDWGGPKTYGKLQQDSGDKILFVDGSPEKHELKLGRIKAGKIQSISLLNAEYRRH